MVLGDWIDGLRRWLGGESPRIKRQRAYFAAAVILVIHLLLGVLYSVTVPVWEAVDETGHYTYVRYLATNKALPPIGGQLTEWADEAHQPPLYYLLGAVTTFWIDTSDDLHPQINLHAWDGTGRRGYNIAFHPEEEGFPYRGTVLAIHVTRLMSVLVSTLVVFLTYLLALEIAPGRQEIALGAMAITAFSPVFIFTGSAINNDILVALLTATVFLCTLRAIKAKQLWPWTVALGISLGLALLSKNNALALVPFVAVSLAVGALERGKSWRVFAYQILAVFALASLISGWWYARNSVLYGTPLPYPGQEERTAADFAPHVAPTRQSPSLRWLLVLLWYTFRSFWGYFGWGNVVITNRWFYAALLVLILSGGVGLVFFLRSAKVQRAIKSDTALLILGSFLFSGPPIYRAIYMDDPRLVPGRYLLPVFPALSLLICLGLSWHLPRRFSRALLYLIGGCFLLAGIIVPFRVIAPAYARPPLLSEVDLPPEQVLDINFGNRMQLLGYELGTDRLLRGEELSVILYWRALSEMQNNYTVSVHILGRNLQSWGQLDTHPGRGTFPTSFWKVGDTFADTYLVPLSRQTPVPSLGRISVGVHLYPGEEQLPALDSSGNEVTPIFGRLKLARRRPLEYEIENPLAFRLDDQVELRGYEIEPLSARAGETIRLTLYWQTQRMVEEDYTVFLHLLSDDGVLVAQQDSQPLSGDYPTSLWDEGETVKDELALSLPQDIAPGEYNLVVGMYLLETLQRLPVYDENGNRLPNDVIPLLRLTVAGAE